MTFKYLNENNIKAIPFDKGIGFCLMTNEDYVARLDKITGLSQFKSVERSRKNEKHPILKEEERICKQLKQLKQRGKIDEYLANI